MTDQASQELRWRVDRRMTVLKAVGAVVFLVAPLVFGGGAERFTLGLIAASLLGAFAVRDLIVPVRLTADGHGVTVVAGFAGRRHIPWGDVERVRVDVRRRLGRRSELLEIDTGQTLHLFSAAELGEPPDEAAAKLVTLRTGR
jgi:hypothetical protein